MLRKLSLNTQTLAVRVQPQHQSQISRSPSPQLEEKMPQEQIETDEEILPTHDVVARSKNTTEMFTLNLAHYVKFALARTKSTGAWQAQLQIPGWLSTSVYELISAPAVAGWTYTYRVYNVIPDNSEIILKVKRGDLVGVRQMFSSKQASPFDKSQRGDSLLHVCMSDYQLRPKLTSLSTRPPIDSMKYASFYSN
jgi:hypothetical protein